MTNKKKIGPEQHFNALVNEISRCTICKDSLPEPPKPIINIGLTSKLLIIGQAPGILAHNSSTPWNDRSGDRLRNWLCIDKYTFYDKNITSLMPMGFCFPGYKNGADAPPSKLCAPTWHKQITSLLSIECTLLVGRYAQKFYMPSEKTLTNAVKLQPCSDKNTWVLPHPSGRNNRWLKQSPWFEEEQLPRIRHAVSNALKSTVG